RRSAPRLQADEGARKSALPLLLQVFRHLLRPLLQHLTPLRRDRVPVLRVVGLADLRRKLGVPLLELRRARRLGLALGLLARVLGLLRLVLLGRLRVVGVLLRLAVLVAAAAASAAGRAPGALSLLDDLLEHPLDPVGHAFAVALHLLDELADAF